MSDCGHGHVYPSNIKARCGGPLICSQCAADLANKTLGGDSMNNEEVPAINKSDLEKQYPILKFFAFMHLPPHLQLISGPISAMAYNVAANSNPGAETSAGLRKLLEAKDCFVRAAI